MQCKYHQVKDHQDLATISDVPIVTDIQLAIVGNATIPDSRIENHRRKTIMYELIVHERTHNDKRMHG
jgi:hypothetical protein